MDINFHYFAIKTLALRAGFTDEKAQIIAYYSQMVDDFNMYRYLVLDRVPEYIIENKLAKKISANSYLFNTVTTGFISTDDLLRLSTERYQRTITTPFHFITKTPINSEFLNNKAERSKLRVTPATLKPSNISEKSLIQEMLDDACEKYLSVQSNDNLIKIGILLHIFADTYAHQQFSGFWGWENHSYLVQVKNNVTQEVKNYEETTNLKNLTRNFQVYYHCPSIGHTNVGHIPDISYLSFEMKNKISENDKYSNIYRRNNTKEFIKAAKEILDYLRKLLRVTEVVNDEDFFKNLELGLLLLYNPDSQEGIQRLEQDWSGIFKDYKYSYDKSMFFNYIESFEDIFCGNAILKYTILNDDFFIFNNAANRICSQVNADSNILSKYFKEITDLIS